MARNAFFLIYLLCSLFSMQINWLTYLFDDRTWFTVMQYMREQRSSWRCSEMNWCAHEWSDKFKSSGERWFQLDSNWDIIIQAWIIELACFHRKKINTNNLPQTTVSSQYWFGVACSTYAPFSSENSRKKIIELCLCQVQYFIYYAYV